KIGNVSSYDDNVDERRKVIVWGESVWERPQNGHVITQAEIEQLAKTAVLKDKEGMYQYVVTLIAELRSKICAACE
ncbi:unnamed protein product, partial [Soboliphyme baturini]|uniref:Peptidase S74 domain-containing protein n=1 Tax=Soboliphyme baturini TaxID=241478 RepID=A0A183IX14_9BILA